MPMNPTALAQRLIDEMPKVDATTKTAAMDAAAKFGEVVSNYVFENCQVTFAWGGIFITPAGVSMPDPVVTYTASVSGNTNFPGIFASVADFSTRLGLLVGNWTIAPDDPSFIVPPTTLLPKPIPIVVAGLNKFEDCMNALATQIIAGIMTAQNPVPVMGAHGTFTAPTGVGGLMTLIT